MKPNCYECKFRGSVPGSTHSNCKHPQNGQSLDDPVSSLIALLGRGTLPQPDTNLNIKGNPHGIRNNWFNWPWNFDPVWLESCDGFEQKGE